MPKRHKDDKNKYKRERHKRDITMASEMMRGWEYGRKSMCNTLHNANVMIKINILNAILATFMTVTWVHRGSFVVRSSVSIFDVLTPNLIEIAHIITLFLNPSN